MPTTKNGDVMYTSTKEMRDEPERRRATNDDDTNPMKMTQMPTYRDDSSREAHKN